MNDDTLEKLEEIYSNPEECAHILKLKYIRDSQKGITRRLYRRHFQYIDPKGKVILNEETIDRINKLRIPPAWKNVWIAPNDHYYLQAVGIDKKGRKQYLYHPKWNEFRKILKFYKLIIVGRALPKIRQKVETYLKQKGLYKEKVISSVIKIIDNTYIRIGNDQYANENESFGITTIHDEHVKVKGEEIKFHFKGKSGQEQNIKFKDEKLARIVKKLIALPGKDVFQYESDKGKVIDVKSSDVNAFLKEISGHDITAKDFRTWGGTRICLEELQSYDHNLNKKEIKSALTCVIKTVASHLGNTQAVSRSHYIHPQVINTFTENEFEEAIEKSINKSRANHMRYMDSEEKILLEFLQEFFKREMNDLLS